MKEIRFIDLKSQYLDYKEEINRAIQTVLDSTTFIHGKEVEKLEKSLAQYVGTGHCISASSGTDALLLSLMAIGIKPGDEVITTPFTFIASASVIAMLGAVPVFVDIEEETYNINPGLIEKKISEKTKAIIPVSLYGQCAELDQIQDIGNRYNIFVIEDACQSFGAEYNGRKSGAITDIGCTSFFPSKPLGCYGDGGAIFVNNDELAYKIRCLMNHGQTERYNHKLLGINGRLDAIQAAILNVKLKYFEKEVESRIRIGSRYTSLLSEKVITPIIKKGRTSVYAQYSIRVNNREKVIKELNQKGIPTAVHYPIPLYGQEVFNYLGISPEDFPVTEKVCHEIMSLPMSPYLSVEDQDYIVKEILDNA